VHKTNYIPVLLSVIKEVATVMVATAHIACAEKISPSYSLCGIDVHPCTWFLGHTQVYPETAFRAVPPFLQGCNCVLNRQTDRQTDRHTVVLNRQTDLQTDRPTDIQSTQTTELAPAIRSRLQFVILMTDTWRFKRCIIIIIMTGYKLHP